MMARTRLCRSLQGAAAIILMFVCAQALAFESVTDEDVLNRGPSMGPIDAERPAPKYIKKETFGEVTGLSQETKKREDFSDPSFNYKPVFEEPLPRWGMELRLAPYRPQFGNDAKSVALYDLVMVKDNTSGLFAGRPMMLALEGDYYVWRGFGLLGAYGRVGYWQVQAASRSCVAADGTTPVPCSADTVFSSVPGQDRAEFIIVPVSGGIIYRFDGLKRRTPVPLIVTAKLGLDGHLWFGNSGGGRALYQGHKAQGSTLGWHASVGLSLNLDGLAKRALSRVRSHVQNSLFVELATVQGKALLGSDRAHRVNFTDSRVITAGFACDFR